MRSSPQNVVGLSVWRLALTGFVLFGGNLHTTVSQAATPTKVFINDREIYFSPADMVKINGRTLVAMRPIFEGLGMNVDWNGPQKKITSTRGNQTIIMWIGNKYATVDGNRVALDQPPILVKGRTLVPLRFIGESLHADVKWNAGAGTINIADPGSANVVRNPRLPPQRSWQGVFTSPTNDAELAELADVRGEITAMSASEPIRRLVLQIARPNNNVASGWEYWDNSLNAWREQMQSVAVDFDEKTKQFSYPRVKLKFGELPPGSYTLRLFAVHTNYDSSTVATANFTIKK